MEKLKGIGENERGAVGIDVEKVDTKVAYDYQENEFSATSYEIKVTEYSHRIIDDSLAMTEAQHIDEIINALHRMGVTKIKWH